MKKSIIPTIFFLSIVGLVLITLFQEQRISQSSYKSQTTKINNVFFDDSTVRPLHSSNDLIRGNPDAEVFIVEYADLQCPFCHEQHPVFQRLVLSDYVLSGSVAWVFRHYPHIDQISRQKAKFVECTRIQYGSKIAWATIDRLTTANAHISFPNQDIRNKLNEISLLEDTEIDIDSLIKCSKEDSSIEDFINQEYEDAKRIGAVETPYIIVLSKRYGINSKSSNIYAYEEIVDLLNQILSTSFQGKVFENIEN